MRNVAIGDQANRFVIGVRSARGAIAQQLGRLVTAPFGSCSIYASLPQTLAQDWTLIEPVLAQDMSTAPIHDASFAVTPQVAWKSASPL